MTISAAGSLDSGEPAAESLRVITRDGSIRAMNRTTRNVHRRAQRLAAAAG
jgi:hypothetical protein